MSLRAGLAGTLAVVVLAVGASLYLWGVRGPAIMLDYVWALCF